ncbi:hypothetical protein GLV94_02960 [Virgibacillus halodenitrificans]|uniref:major capsid protein n=1 Tax=Virgibacillus halodenitrificans TaxID=1482 RepID=UPI001371450C|nr:major capsid protein [Virgibacillus halodenitrificans]MYL44593.1 hypothetical protein [Virgibacillus halodenitrificans]
MPLHLDEFQQPTLTGYVQNVPPQREYLLESVMPEDPTYDINFAYNVINGKYATAASITGWNASAPLRDTDEQVRAFGQVSKVQHSFRLNETQLLQYNRPRSENESNAVIEGIYQSTDKLSVGVDDIKEFMRAQAVYNGVLKYDDDENDVHLNIDFGIPASNKLSATTAWNTTGAKPLEDIQAAVAQFKKANQRRKPNVIHMTEATEALLLNNEQIRTQVYGKDSGQRILTKNDLQNIFSALSLPPYQINDDVIVVNDVEVPLLEDGKVVLLGNNLGNTMIGPTVENNYEPGKFAKPKIENDPPAQTVIVGEAVFPALKQPKSIVIMSV